MGRLPEEAASPTPHAVAPHETGRRSTPDEAPVWDLFAAIKSLTAERDSLLDRLREERGKRRQQSADLRQAQEGTLKVLASAVELRDGYTGGHLKRVAHYAVTLHNLVAPGALVYEDAIGFTIHDLGKLGIPDSILLKPGPLDPDEEWTMRKHPIMGAALIQNLPFLRRSVPVVRHHHERWDGQGYPDGLADDQIPLSARVFAVADSFDAATTDRPYRDARSTGVAVDDIIAGGGRAYDPAVITAFTYAASHKLLTTPAIN